MGKEKQISKAVIKRLPRYRRYLRELQKKGVEKISSKDMSRLIGYTASQIRQDLNNFGGFGGGAGFVNDGTIYQILSYLPLVLVCVIASTPVVKLIYSKLAAKANEGVLLTADIARMLGISALSIAFLISGSYNPFLYFRF